MSIYRERFAATLAHKPVDRCPIDLGGTPQSTVESPRLVKEIASLLDFEGDPPAEYDKFDKRILEHFDIDFRRAGILVQFETNRNRRISDFEFIDEYGITHRFGGLYWDMVEGPLAGGNVDDIAGYVFPKAHEILQGTLDDCADKAKHLYEKTQYVVVGEHPVFGVLELACWLCGYDYIMLMMALDAEFIHLLFARILEFQKSIIKEYYGRLGKYIHLTTSGDDFGTQKGLFMSPEMWRQFVKPYMKERIDYTMQFTDAIYMHHTCGAVFDIMGDLIEIGVKIINPIQPAAEGMAPARLKAHYGDKVTFHGGLDTQDVLPSNDPERIDVAVTSLIATMDARRTGGFIFAPAHNIQGDVTPTSVARMYSSALMKGMP